MTGLSWQTLLTTLITLVIVTVLVKKSRYSTPPGVLKYGLFMQGFALVCLTFALIPFYLLLTQNYQTDQAEETVSLAGLTIGFGFVAVYIIGEAFLVHGNYDHDQIQFYTPWTGKKVQQWNDLISVKFNAICYWHTIKFKDCCTIRISSYMGGNGYLLDLLRSKGLLV